jgi:hypothetical protein
MDTDHLIVKKNMKTYAIRCFIDGERKFTHKLTKKQAQIFRQAAKHLSKYLKTEYKLK